MVESFISGNEMNCDHREPYGGVAELGISDIEFDCDKFCVFSQPALGFGCC